MSRWHEQCQGPCRNEFVSDRSINDLHWFALRDTGWLLQFGHTGALEVVRCPEHHAGPPVGQWLVRCIGDCDWEEEFDTEEEARSAAREHESHLCCIECFFDHTTRVVSPEEQEERKKRVQEVQQQRRQAEQTRRDIEEPRKPRRRRFHITDVPRGMRRAVHLRGRSNRR